MKNRLFCLLLASFFIIGNMSNGQAASILMDQGVDLLIVQVKTGSTVSTISIPENYVDKEGNLIMPMEITLTQNQKMPVFSVQTTDLSINLPSSLSGVYYINVRIGDFVLTQKITL